MTRRLAVAALLLLMALALVGKSAVMAVSVAGVAVAWRAARSAGLGRTLAAVAVAAVGAALLAEAAHTGYHRFAPGTGDDTGGFWVGATLVGLIDAVAFGAVLLVAAWAEARQARASRSSAS